MPAQLQPAAERSALQMPTSTGKLRDMTRIGTLEFTLKGQPLKLARFSRTARARLFVPFSDLTSGTETYQAGRYMNLDPTPTGIYIVDFNIAYHPYCYYNAEYDCPFPPAENRLTLPIRAGERLRKADSDGPAMTRALHAIVFDFDGVIADSERLHLRRVPGCARAARARAQRRGVLRDIPRLRRCLVCFGDMRKRSRAELG